MVRTSLIPASAWSFCTFSGIDGDVLRNSFRPPMMLTETRQGLLFPGRGGLPPRVSTPIVVSLKGVRHGPAALATASCPETAATHPQRNPWLCRRRCSPAHSTADATRSARGKSRASSSCRRVQKCGEGERACARRIKKRLPSLVSRTLGILGAAAPAACSPPRLTAEALREKPFLAAASMAPRTRWWWEGGESRALEQQTSCDEHMLLCRTS